MSPVTTICEPKPSRVRNIFICSGEVFCASSRMMNASLSVRPRMYASGATSMVPSVINRGIGRRFHHVVQRVVQRTQVRVDLLGQRARQEPEPLARLDGGPGQDDPGDLLGLQRLHRLGDGQVGLAGARRADGEDDRVLVDGVDVALLVERLGRDRLAAVAQDVVRQDVGRALVLTIAQHRRPSARPPRRSGPVRCAARPPSRRPAARPAPPRSTGPVKRISLPRTWMSTSGKSALDRHEAARHRSRAAQTMSRLRGTTMRCSILDRLAVGAGSGSALSAMGAPGGEGATFPSRRF